LPYARKGLLLPELLPLALAKNKTNIKLTRKLEWLIFIVFFSLVPYLIRLGFWSIWGEDVPEFYISEMDMFLCSISVTVALFSELKHIRILPFDLDRSVVYAVLMVYIVLLFGGIFMSFEFEHRMSVLNSLKESALQGNKSVDEIVKSISQLESKKYKLFITSCLLALISVILSYRTNFNKRNV
jgi:hypothetical protein